MSTPGPPELIAEAIDQDHPEDTNEVVSEVASEVLPGLLSPAIGSPLPASRPPIPFSRIGTGEGYGVGLAVERERLQ